MLNTNYKRPAVLDISNLLNTPYEYQKSPSLSPSLTSSPASVSSYTSYPFPGLWDDMKHHTAYHAESPISMDEDLFKSQKESEDELEEEDTDEDSPIKAKRRRANAKQLEVLNRVFDRTFFPSTQMRAELGRQLGMSPRTVQIWFQNRRQAMRTRERQRLIRLRHNN
ncbi:Short stature homeobox protein [Choanephora cucurbitarum]|uniref:Short stature homeobox protein n=1 Tax=Choanephora cucurbitarum TaxID=101091 RepID=A0A1C7MYL0_9FUNG|nr:Short stature homeobox protein [Choanephora cucurbitarum]